MTKIKPLCTLMKEKDAAIKIQRFWQNRQCYAGLSGNRNYDYYLTLLGFSKTTDFYTLLAQMMYGRVIATPTLSFPFLKKLNPYVGSQAVYHRNDVLGSELSATILRQWGNKVDPNCIYIPVVNSHLGTIDDALIALNWQSSEYALIEAPNSLAYTGYLKFIQLKRAPTPREDEVFTVNNRWGKISSLGIIASPWLLSVIAASSILENSSYTAIRYNPASHLVNASLIRQPQTIEQLKKSDLIKRLKQLKKQSASGSSLLATGLYAMIKDLPSDIDAPHNVARLSLFIETALLMHRKDHAFFANFIYPIIHEISLLLIQYRDLKKKPYINHDEYQSITLRDMSTWIDLDSNDYAFVAFPAHSGMHALLIALKFARDICGKLPSIRSRSYEYWEAIDDTRAYLSLVQRVFSNNANIISISAGPIGDYSNGTYPAIDLNKLLREELTRNYQFQTLIIDITSASYEHLKLDADVKQLLAQKSISLIFWESAQKFGLLHTDQAQYGRVFAFCNKNRVSSALIAGYKRKAVDDMDIPDVQIGTFINKHFQKIMPVIRERHFSNGAICRTILFGHANAGINAPYMNTLQLADQKDPFVSLDDYFSDAQQQKIDYFFQKMHLNRESFGHRYTTQAGGVRISAGAEHPVDMTILITSLKYYLQFTTEELYQQLIQQTNTLDICNQEQLIGYLSMMKAWHISNAPQQTITLMMAERFRSLIMDDHDLVKKTLNGSRQYVADIYTLFKKKSPFEMMHQEALVKQDVFAMTLFQTFNIRFKKTGAININNAIKQAIRTLHRVSVNETINDKIIQEYKQKLLDGTYSQHARTFFSKIKHHHVKDKEAAIYEQNAKLYLKAKDLTDRGHFEVALVITKACEQIKKTMRSTAMDQEKYKKINDILLQTMHNALVRQHRNVLTPLLINFLMIISVVGAFYLMATAKTRGSFFYRPHTTTENILAGALDKLSDKHNSLS